VGALKAGAVDFIEKPFSDEVMLGAIEAAFDREQKTGRNNADAAKVQARLASLTAREKEVLDGLLVGHPNKTIAYDLGISPRTVEVHRANVMTKMGASSLSELVRMTLVAGNS
jgi:two-component system, LuxR family, response regulator FixJ